MSLDINRSLGIAIDEEGFKRLISGGVLHTKGIALILQDIGWQRMIDLINEAWETQRGKL